MLAVGCQGEELPPDRVETQIEKRLLRPIGLGGRAECPGGIEQGKDNDFTCEVTVGDRRVKVRVTQRDDEGKLTFRPLPSRR